MKLLVLLNNLNMTTAIFGPRLTHNKARFQHLDIRATGACHPLNKLERKQTIIA
jgi:hypothetical protein